MYYKIMKYKQNKQSTGNSENCNFKSFNNMAWHICFNSSSTSSRHKSYVICFSGVLFIFMYKCSILLNLFANIGISRSVIRKVKSSCKNCETKYTWLLLAIHPYTFFSFTLVACTLNRPDTLVSLNSPQKYPSNQKWQRL